MEKPKLVAMRLGDDPRGADYTYKHHLCITTTRCLTCESNSTHTEVRTETGSRYPLTGSGYGFHITHYTTDTQFTPFCHNCLPPLPSTPPPKAAQTFKAPKTTRASPRASPAVKMASLDDILGD